MDKKYTYAPNENTRNVIIEKYYMINKTLWTKNCVICFESNVTQYGGHVHKNTISIIAGFCSKHSHTESTQQCQGCYGEYKKEMGMK